MLLSLALFEMHAKAIFSFVPFLALGTWILFDCKSSLLLFLISVLSHMDLSQVYGRKGLATHLALVGSSHHGQLGLDPLFGVLYSNVSIQGGRSIEGGVTMLTRLLTCHLHLLIISALLNLWYSLWHCEPPCLGGFDDTTDT